MERNSSVDVLKFICAIYVVTIHSGFVGNAIIEPYLRCAVPIFFMLSGYFIYNKIVSNDVQRIAIDARRILKILLISVLAYTPPLLVDHYLIGIDFGTSYKTIINTIFFNDTYPVAPHLWYLSAYIYVLVMVVIAMRSQKWLKLQHLSFLLYSIIIVMLYLSFVIRGKGLNSVYYRNFLFEGLPYFSFGALLSQYKYKLNKIPKARLYIGICVLVVASYFEFKILHNNGIRTDIYILTLPMSVAVVIVALRKKVNSKNMFARLGREYSLPLYIVHFFIANHIVYLFKNDKTLVEYYYYVSPIVVTLVSLGLIYAYRSTRRVLSRGFIA